MDNELHPDPPAAPFPALKQLIAASAPPFRDQQQFEAAVSASARSAANEPARPAEVAARNEACPFCSETIASLEKPVAVLTCGHAYHTMCGRALLYQAEGRECTFPECHRTPADVERDHKKSLVDAAVRRGEFSLDDLSDPVRARDINALLVTRMNEVKRTGDAHAVSLEAARKSSNSDDRSLDAYKARWRRTRVGQKGLKKKQRIAILFPYTKNVVQAGREHVTLASLYTREDALRRAAQDASANANNNNDSSSDEDNDNASASASGGTQGMPLMSAERAAVLSKRISVDRFVKAGLTVADLYFALELNDWQTLVDLGFRKDHITTSRGAYPVTALADLYGVDFEAFRRDLGWKLDDIARKSVTAQELSNIGLDFSKMYVGMGMEKADMPSFGFTATGWHDVLGLDKKYLFNPLAFNSADLRTMGWKTSAFSAAFALVDLEMDRLGIDANAPGPSSSGRQHLESQEDYDFAGVVPQCVDDCSPAVTLPTLHARTDHGQQTSGRNRGTRAVATVTATRTPTVLSLNLAPPVANTRSPTVLSLNPVPTHAT